MSAIFGASITVPQAEIALGHCITELREVESQVAEGGSLPLVDSRYVHAVHLVFDYATFWFKPFFYGKDPVLVLPGEYFSYDGQKIEWDEKSGFSTMLRIAGKWIASIVHCDNPLRIIVPAERIVILQN